MASTILTNWTVYYADDAGGDNTGYKQIRWTGAGVPETNTNTVNELYSALMNLFSIDSQNDASDTTPMYAVTPTRYRIGAFDAGDLEPWFIDPISIQHLTGSGLESNNWTRVTGASATEGNSGIVKVPYTTGTQFVDNDIGRTVTNGTSNSTGTLLYYDSTNNEAWIRPTSSVTLHDWGGSTGTITVTGGTGSVTQSGPGVSGERVWSNIYSIGSIASYTQIYVNQSFTKVNPPWWGSGHIDRLFLTDDDFDSGLIDSGLIDVFARQYGKLYDHFQADLSGGGRSPIPIATSNDTNNTSGYWTLTASGISGTFNVGNYIYAGASWATATKKGVITAVAGSNITYYLIGDLTNFATDAITEWTGTADDATASSTSSPTAAGPTTGNPAAITVTFGYTSQDIGDGNGSQPYSVIINMNGNTSIAELYNRLKYLTRRGQETDIDNGSQSIIGERYIAVGDVYIAYASETGTFTEGLVVSTSTGSGTITALQDNGTTGYLVVRDVRGTFSDAQAITDTSTGAATISGTPETITPVKVSPFGTKAGDNFFGARGVWIANPGAYANNYVLIDNNGETRTPPSTVSVSITNTISGDRVSVFRAEDGDTNGNINSTYLTSHASSNAAGNTSFVVDAGTPIPNDTPATGVVRVVDEPGKRDHRYRYASWTGSTFTFVTSGIPSGNIDTPASNPKEGFRDDNANLANALPGDMIRNTNDDCWAHIVSVTLVSGTTYDVVHTPLESGTNNYWTASDGYAVNTIVETYNGSDTAYVPYIDQTATGTSVSTSVQYVSERNITTRVRHKGVIQPFINNVDTLDSSGYSTSVSRIPDTIAS